MSAAGSARGGEVDEHGVLEAGRDGDVLDAVGVERPAQDVDGCNCSTLSGAWSRLTRASYLITTNSIKI